MLINRKDDSVILSGTTNQPHDDLVITLDEMEQLADFYQHEQDKAAVKEYLKTAINIPGSAEVSAELAKKYLYDANLLDQLIEESNHNQEDFGDDFLTSVAKGVKTLEEKSTVKEWEGITRSIANRMTSEFLAERNPSQWTGFGEVPDGVSLEPLNFPIDDIYPEGNEPVLRMQLVGVTFPKLHYVCECSIIENGVDLWARRTLDSMTVETVEDLVDTVLYVARTYELSKCFRRVYVQHASLDKEEYDGIIAGFQNGIDYKKVGYISVSGFFPDDLDMTITWTCDNNGKVYNEAILHKNSSEQVLSRSGRMYKFCSHYILPYKGAEYHVFVDVLPEPHVLEKTIYISEKYAETIEKYLRGKELQGLDATLSETATFPDGFDMDIRCCGTDVDSFTEAILYDRKGKAVALTDPCDTFTGCWELEDETTGTTYRVHVMTKPRVN